MSKRFRGPVPFRASVASPTCAERDPYSKLDKLDQLVLNRNQLSGSIPVGSGDMDSLSQLWLRDNGLSGQIPQELQDLNLAHLHLSGNSFSGCIPSGLGDVETNDLDRLGLSYCSSPES